MAIIVTEFPKITETFTYREAVVLRRMGMDVRIFFLTHFRRSAVIHDFAEELTPNAFGRPWLLGGGVFTAFCRTLVRQPLVMARIAITLTSCYWRSPLLLMKSLAIVPKCTRFAEELRDWRADAVNASFAGHPATAAWIIRQLGGPPYSVTCHAHDIFRSQLMLSTKFRGAAFVRTISDFNVEFLRKALGAAAIKSIEVIHCGVEFDARLRPKPEASEEFTILFVGSLQLRKGVQVLLAALEELGMQREWRCRIVGNGPMAHELQKKAAQSHVASRITFLGSKPAEAVELEYQKADVLVAPSIAGPGGRGEGIPTVLMEGMSHFVPVIASNHTGIPELVRDGVTGLLFEPGDHAALAQELINVMENPRFAAQLAENGYSLVKQEFNLHRNMELFYRLLTGDDPNRGLGENESPIKGK